MADAGERPASELRRKQAEDLLRTGFEIFGDVDDVILAGARFTRDTGQTRFAQLKLRHADYVLDAHSHGKVTGNLADQCTVCAGKVDEATHAREVALGI